MSRRTFAAIAAAMTIAAAAVRLNNVFTFPVLGGYDAFAHFTYIRFVAETGRVPLADSGWEFFQPPLYYAWMAAFWRGLAGVDPELRLRIGNAVIALLGLVPAAVAFAIVRRRWPRQRTIQLLTAGSMLFLPTHLYSAGFVGNEALTAVLCSIALLLLLDLLAAPTAPRAALLGLCLGLAMLAKFTAIVVVATALATLVLRGVVRGELRRAAVCVATAATVMLAVCGWYYGRNIELYGTPFPLSREQLFLARVEDSQLQGERRFLEYVLFDPGILYRPQWPRGLSMHSPRPPGVAYSALRESLPTGFYANTWFDGSGSFVLAPVTGSEASRRAGQLLLTLALVPTSLMLFGVVASIAGLARRGWDAGAVAMLAALAAMAVVTVQGTLTVPTQAAVKGTYLMPVSVAFAFFFAVGLARLHGTRLQGAAAALCALLFAVSALVFAHGRVLEDAWFREGLENSTVRNIYGVMYHAGGEPERAEWYFEQAARSGSYLGYENLAASALGDGDRAAARYLLLRAAALQPGQARGTPAQRRRAIAATQADYANSLGVILYEDGDYAGSREALAKSQRLDPRIPETSYNLGTIAWIESCSCGGSAGRMELLSSAARSFARALELDPAFLEAETMQQAALTGDCRWFFEGAPLPRLHPLRAYPVETGPGDLNDAGLLRRRLIEVTPVHLSRRAAAGCG